MAFRLARASRLGCFPRIWRCHGSPGGKGGGGGGLTAADWRQDVCHRMSWRDSSSQKLRDSSPQRTKVWA